MVTFIFLSVITWGSAANPIDSLRTEKINGKLFIIHQVSEKETLYAISRRYGVPVSAIIEANPKMDEGLDVGKLLKVPYTPKVKPAAGNSIHIVAPKETLFSIAKQYNISVDDLKSWNNLKESSLSVGQQLVIRKGEVSHSERVAEAGTHVVEAKETLFSIAKKYQVSIQQLRDWNSLGSDDLKLGQVLKVSATAVSVVQTSPVQHREDPPTLVIKDSTDLLKESRVTVTGTHGSDEVREGGLAEMIEGTEGNRKYLALHRTAKTGAILKVRNELNNREVFVRIIGPLPDTGVNDKLIIKISKAAYDRLGAIDPKFRVEVTYYK
jgi:LysM repeat protein